jgi:phosphoribosylamine--glycine ligase/phosphoribosylformylglycinamidine cyclo-ligase
MTYADAGVSIDAGNEFVQRIKSLTKRTRRRGAETHPILVSATDGVGTKLFIANTLGKYSTIGMDLVAMNVNDLLVQGAEPLYFLDYYATGHLELENAVKVVEGIAEGCLESNCALIGGETAEMPGLYSDKDFDLAGFTVGIVDRHNLLPSIESMKADDVLIGLSSSGFHSNGYSLIRHILKVKGISYDEPMNTFTSDPAVSSMTIGDALIEPTFIYVPYLLPIIQSHPNLMKGMAHITGGGFTDNIPRVLPDDMQAVLNTASWPLPSIFRLFQKLGNVSDDEMARTWNCGIGMVIVVSAENADALLGLIGEHKKHAKISGKRNLALDMKAYKIGVLRARQPNDPPVLMNNFDTWH